MLLDFTESIGHLLHRYLRGRQHFNQARLDRSSVNHLVSMQMERLTRDYGS